MLRPLARFWFLNSTDIDSDEMARIIVSVPLLGSSILASPVATGEVASNASRWGRLCLAFISDAMMFYNLRSWRPLHRLRGPPADLSKKQALGRS